MQQVIKQYGLSDANFSPLGNGLINTTWLVSAGDKRYVLQRINQQVFKKPADIAFNIRLIASYLKLHSPDYPFTAALQALNGEDLIETPEGIFRMFDYIHDTQTLNVVETPEQAFEAARQFGRFSKLLSGFYASQLRITIPDFHNLTLRYEQFETAVLKGDASRVNQSAALIMQLRQHRAIVDEFESGKQVLRLRCMHHDTKISNVLFDKAGKGFCVIDLDTIMPGYFISDVGDMMRTYLCPVNEEEKDFSGIEVRRDFYEAIVEGYLSEMGAELTEAEKKYFHFAGKFMIYMQALRFLADYLNRDVYYGAKYEGHNFVRAGNQVVLLQRLIELDIN